MDRELDHDTRAAAERVQGRGRGGIVTTRRTLGVALMAGGGLLVAVAVAGATLDGSGDDVASPSSPAPTVSADAEATGSADAEPTETADAPTDTTPSEVATETAEDFLALLVTAFREDDRVFLVERLHPEVIGRYGEATCRDYLGSVTDPEFELTVREVGDPESWAWESDGLTATVEGSIPVEVERAVGSQTVIQEIHLAHVGDELHWFTDCGEPTERGGSS